MAIGEFAPGYYNMTYDGDDPGLVQGVRQLRRKYKAQIISADLYGDTQLDGVYRGSDVFLRMIFKEWNATVRKILWPFDTDFGDLGIPGKLLTDFAKSMVLTALTGTPAATKGPATVTATLALLAPENDVEVIMGNEQRDVPVLIQCFPYVVSTGRVAHFTVT